MVEEVARHAIDGFSVGNVGLDGKRWRAIQLEWMGSGSGGREEVGNSNLDRPLPLSMRSERAGSWGGKLSGSRTTSFKRASVCLGAKDR